MPIDDLDEQVDLETWERKVFEKHGIPEGLRMSIFGQESAGGKNLTSPTGVKGRYQVTQRTAKQYGLNRDDPWEQPIAAAKYLREGYEEAKKKNPNFGDREAWLAASARYYGGPEAFDGQGNLSSQSLDGLSTPAKYAEGIAKRWSDWERSSQQPAAPKAPATPSQPLQPRTTAPQVARQKVTPSAPAMPQTPQGPNPFSLSAPTGFQQAATQAAQRTANLPTRAPNKEEQDFQSRGPLGRMAYDVKTGYRQAQNALANQVYGLGETIGALQYGDTRPLKEQATGAGLGLQKLIETSTFGAPRAATVYNLRQNQLAQERRRANDPYWAGSQESARRDEARAQANPTLTGKVVRGVTQGAVSAAPILATGAVGGTPAILGMTAATQDYTRPEEAALNIASTALPIKAGQMISPLAGRVAGKAASSVAGQEVIRRGIEAGTGGATNAAQYAAVQKLRGEQIDPEEMIAQGVTGAALGTAMAPSRRQLGLRTPEKPYSRTQALRQPMSIIRGDEFTAPQPSEPARPVRFGQRPAPAPEAPGTAPLAEAPAPDPGSVRNALRLEADDAKNLMSQFEAEGDFEKAWAEADAAHNALRRLRREASRSRSKTPEEVSYISALDREISYADLARKEYGARVSPIAREKAKAARSAQKAQENAPTAPAPTDPNVARDTAPLDQPPAKIRTNTVDAGRRVATDEGTGTVLEQLPNGTVRIKMDSGYISTVPVDSITNRFGMAIQDDAQPTQPITGAARQTPAPVARRVRVGNEEVDLTPEQAARWAEEVEKPTQESEARYTRARQSVNAAVRNAAESRRRADAMRIAAKKREIADRLTGKEQAAADQRAPIAQSPAANKTRVSYKWSDQGAAREAYLDADLAERWNQINPNDPRRNGRMATILAEQGDRDNPGADAEMRRNATRKAYEMDAAEDAVAPSRDDANNRRIIQGREGWKIFERDPNDDQSEYQIAGPFETRKEASDAMMTMRSNAPVNTPTGPVQEPTNRITSTEYEGGEMRRYSRPLGGAPIETPDPVTAETQPSGVSARPTKRMTVRDYAETVDMPVEDKTALDRALRNEQAENPRAYDDVTRPGEPGSGGVSFSPYNDLVSNNRAKVNQLFGMDLNSPEATQIIADLEGFAANRNIEPRHVENLLNYIKNDQIESARRDDGGEDIQPPTGPLAPDDPRLNPPTEGLTPRGKVQEVKAEAAKEPWQMTQTEYAKGAKVRRKEPETPYAKFASERGYPVPLEEHGDLRYPHGISKAEARRKEARINDRVTRLAEGQAEYNRLVESGEIPTVEREYGARTGNLSDAANIRVQHKRAVRQAIAEGKPVPAEVLADYPDLAPKTPTRPATADLNAAMQPETGPTVQEIRAQERARIAKLTPEELEAALSEVEGRRNAAIREGSTEAQLADLNDQVRLHRGRRAELVKAKQLPPLNKKQPPRAPRPVAKEAGPVRSPLDQDVTILDDETLNKRIRDAERILNVPDLDPARREKVKAFRDRAILEKDKRQRQPNPEVEAITQAARERQQAASDDMRGLRPTEDDWMTPEEKQIVRDANQGRMQSVTQEAAKIRVAEKRAARQAEKAKPAAEKEAWEMTRGEWQESERAALQERVKVNKGRKRELNSVQQSLVNARLNLIRDAVDHKAAIKKALAEGKPVPADVLADYPDLVKGQAEPERASLIPDAAESARLDRMIAEQEPIIRAMQGDDLRAFAKALGMRRVSGLDADIQARIIENNHPDDIQEALNSMKAQSAPKPSPESPQGETVKAAPGEAKPKTMPEMPTFTRETGGESAVELARNESNTRSQRIALEAEIRKINSAKSRSKMGGAKYEEYKQQLLVKGQRLKELKSREAELAGSISRASAEDAVQRAKTDIERAGAMITLGARRADDAMIQAASRRLVAEIVAYSDGKLTADDAASIAKRYESGGITGDPRAYVDAELTRRKASEEIKAAQAAARQEINALDGLSDEAKAQYIKSVDSGAHGVEGLKTFIEHAKSVATKNIQIQKSVQQIAKAADIPPAAEVEESAKGKLNKDTGLSNLQEKYLTETLKKNLPALAEERPLTIEIPGDGRFKVSSVEAANNLMARMGKKPITDEFSTTSKRVQQLSPSGRDAESLRNYKPTTPKRTPLSPELAKEVVDNSPEPTKPQFVADAEARLRDAGSGKMAGSGGQQLADIAVVAGWRVYRAGIEFADWARAVIDEAGHRVRPYLRDAWDRLQYDAARDAEKDVAMESLRGRIDEAKGEMKALQERYYEADREADLTAEYDYPDKIARKRQRKAGSLEARYGDSVDALSDVRGQVVRTDALETGREIYKPGMSYDAWRRELLNREGILANRFSEVVWDQIQDEPQFVRDAAARLNDAASGKLAGSGARQFADVAIVTGYKAYKAGMKFAEWSRAVIKEAGEDVRPHLRAAWDKITSMRGRDADPAETGGRVKDVLRRVDEIQGKIEKLGDFYEEGDAQYSRGQKRLEAQANKLIAPLYKELTAQRDRVRANIDRVTESISALDDRLMDAPKEKAARLREQMKAAEGRQAQLTRIDDRIGKQIADLEERISYDESPEIARALARYDAAIRANDWKGIEQAGAEVARLEDAARAKAIGLDQGFSVGRQKGERPGQVMGSLFGGLQGGAGKKTDAPKPIDSRGTKALEAEFLARGSKPLTPPAAPKAPATPGPRSTQSLDPYRVKAADLGAKPEAQAPIAARMRAADLRANAAEKAPRQKRAPQNAEEYFAEQVAKSPWKDLTDTPLTESTNKEAREALRKAADQVQRGKMADKQKERIIAAADDLMMAGRLGDQKAVRDARKALFDATRGLEDAGKIRRAGATAWDTIKKATRVTQTLAYGTDVSFAFRQAAPLSTNAANILNTARAFKFAYDALGREAAGNRSILPGSKGAESVHDTLKAHPMYDLGQKAGLELTLFGKAEEVYADNIATKLPWIKRTEAANEAFLDYMRLQEFQKYVKRIDANKDLTGIKRADAIKQAAEIVNTLTGRTDLGEGAVKRVADAMNGIMAAPRLNVSRLQLVNPVWWGKQMKSNPQVARQLAGNVVGIGATWGSLLALGAATGAFKVNLDPEDKDFGKIVSGETRYDITGGMLPVVKLVYQAGKFAGAAGEEARENTQEATAERKRQQGKTIDRVKTYLRGRLGPLAAYASDLLIYGEDFQRRPVTARGAVTPSDPNNLALRFLPPLGAKSAYESYQKSGAAGIAKTMPAEFLGIGARIYDEDAPGRLDRKSRVMGEADSLGVDFGNLQRKKGEPDNLFKQRSDKTNEWFDSYGQKLLDSAEYKKLDAEDKKKAIRMLRSRVGSEANQVRPNVRSFEPGMILRSLREGERRQERGRSRLIYSPEPE